jgi:hypothetical protein
MIDLKTLELYRGRPEPDAAAVRRVLVDGAGAQFRNVKRCYLQEVCGLPTARVAVPLRRTGGWSQVACVRMQQAATSGLACTSGQPCHALLCSSAAVIARPSK